MKNREIYNRIRGWLPKSPDYTLQNTDKINLDNFYAKATISVFASLTFVALSVTVGFSLSTGRDFRIILTLGTLLFALPFGYSIYRTYLSTVGFVAFGLTVLLSITAGVSTVNTMLFSLSACIGTALIITIVKHSDFHKAENQVTPDTKERNMR